MQTSELVAGRELDALIAEKVMGMMVWEGWTGTIAAVPPRDKHLWIDLPNYSTDIAAAWQVVDHFERLGLVEIGKYYGWRVRFGDVEGDADTAPLAICRAALAAVSR